MNEQRKAEKERERNEESRRSKSDVEKERAKKIMKNGNREKK